MKPTTCRECGKPAVAKRLCRNHYQAIWNATHPKTPEQREQEKRRAHAKTEERRAEKRREIERQAVAGELAYDKPSIKRDPTTYKSAHNRVRYYRGKPSQYPCVDCGGAATEWAYNNNTDSPYAQEGWHEKEHRKNKSGTTRLVWSTWSANPFDYDPMCSSCHRKRDAAIMLTGKGHFDRKSCGEEVA